MKKLIIALILLSGCSGNLYNDNIIVQEIHKTNDGCNYLVRSINHRSQYMEYTIRDCPCGKWNVGDTVRFE